MSAIFHTVVCLVTLVEGQHSKGFYARNLKGLTKGGLRSSLFTLFSGTVGAGLLTLPKIVTYYGMVVGVSGLIAFAFLTYIIYGILNDLITLSNKKSYANVCSHFFGKVLWV